MNRAARRCLPEGGAGVIIGVDPQFAAVIGSGDEGIAAGYGDADHPSQTIPKLSFWFLTLTSTVGELPVLTGVSVLKSGSVDHVPLYTL